MKENSFNCPNCSGKEYEEVTGSNSIIGPGYISWIEYYYCTNCTIMFTNVEKFSASLKKEKKED